jgi:hypothetical protein
LEDFKMRPSVFEALRAWYRETYGMDMKDTNQLLRQETIERLEELAIPGEDLNDTILRVIIGNASTAKH